MKKKTSKLGTSFIPARSILFTISPSALPHILLLEQPPSAPSTQEIRNTRYNGQLGFSFPGRPHFLRGQNALTVLSATHFFFIDIVRSSKTWCYSRGVSSRKNMPDAGSRRPHTEIWRTESGGSILQQIG